MAGFFLFYSFIPDLIYLIVMQNVCEISSCVVFHTYQIWCLNMTSYCVTYEHNILTRKLILSVEYQDYLLLTINMVQHWRQIKLLFIHWLWCFTRIRWCMVQDNSGKSCIDMHGVQTTSFYTQLLVNYCVLQSSCNKCSFMKVRMFSLCKTVSDRCWFNCRSFEDVASDVVELYCFILTDVSIIFSILFLSMRAG